MNEWIEWHGGPNPVSAATKVDVIFRDGIAYDRVPAYGLHWLHCGQGKEPYAFHSGAEIIKYRIAS